MMLSERSKVRCMTYSYNRLWKLLINKRMTKTEIRKTADISTNILAILGKDELVKKSLQPCNSALTIL